MDPEDEAPPRPAPPGWPPPHPSPPLPPPREYGTPGTPLAWRPWLWGSLAVLVVAALVTVGLVVLLPGDDTGDDGQAAGEPDGQPTTSTSSTSSSAEPTTPAAPAPYRCWDGSDAQKLKDCSLPTGEEGMRWVFPHLADQRCGKATTTGPGVVLRVLCTARLTDGTRIQLGYYEWDTVSVGADFYDDQNLTGTDVKGFHIWSGGAGDTLKSALLYAAAPFSQTVTAPSGAAAATPEDLKELQPRPPNQVRGEPVG